MSSLSLQGQLLIEVFLKPGYAYLRYKLEDYDGARRTLLRISALDQRLITEFGLVYLGAHRLQLATNLLRIHTRLGERSEAMQLGEAMLDYLELRVEAPSNDLLCRRAVLDSVPAGMAEHYFDKISGELAVFLAGKRDAQTSNLFQPLIDHTKAEDCLHGFAPRAHAWMRMKQLSLNDEIETALEAAIDLLQDGVASSPSLWFATVIEVMGLCRSFGGDAATVADWMAAEASSVIEAPWELKQAIHHR